MAYKNAARCLPPHLLAEIQKYVEGDIVYIPKRSQRRRWGELSGARQLIDRRNHRMAQLYQQGVSVEELAERFHLSIESVRKIVYGRGTE